MKGLHPAAWDVAESKETSGLVVGDRQLPKIYKPWGCLGSGPSSVNIDKTIPVVIGLEQSSILLWELLFSWPRHSIHTFVGGRDKGHCSGNRWGYARVGSESVEITAAHLAIFTGRPVCWKKYIQGLQGPLVLRDVSFQCKWDW